MEILGQLEVVEERYEKLNELLSDPEFEPIVTRNVEIIGECVGVYREL